MKIVPVFEIPASKIEASIVAYKAMGAKETFIMRASEKDQKEYGMPVNTIMHAEFNLNGESFYLGTAEGEETVQAACVVGDKQELKVAKQQFDALCKEGTVVMPMELQFWGAEFGIVIDKFGVKWMFNIDTK